MNDIKAMKCSDQQSNLALYAVGSADAADGDAVKAHLESCPLCRQKFDEFRDIATKLRTLRRPDISSALKNSIKQNFRAELRRSRTSWLPITRDGREWLMLRFMPYSVGVCASLLVALTFLTMMSAGMLKSGVLPKGESSVFFASNRDPFNDSSSEITPSEYAKTRLAFSEESPSINPNGALIALTKSLVRGGMKDDEVVVVADIFGNGLAQIAEVVEPSHDRRAVIELEKALGTDLSYAPFVPANLENRPDSVRVVLKFQHVNVNTAQQLKPKKVVRPKSLYFNN